MAFDPSYGLGGFVASTPANIPDFGADLEPIFNLERVGLEFQIASDFVAVQVANNVIILALASNRLLRIDLHNPQDVDDVDLPKKVNEVGTIRNIFLDPTASHLLITTTHGENFYLHSRATKARYLNRLKGVVIESVAWSPAQPTTSTREILLGTQDGTVYECYIEASEEFMRRDERYMKQVLKVQDGQPITGVYVDALPGQMDLRRVIVTTPTKIMHFVGKISRHGHDIAPIFTKFFESEVASVQEFKEPSSRSYSMLSISPEPKDDYGGERYYAWLSSTGVYHGTLYTAPATSDLGTRVFAGSKLLTKSALPNVKGEITSIALTHWHILILCGSTVYAVSKLDDSVVFQEDVSDVCTKILGICMDPKNSTYWVSTSESIYEILETKEDRDVWRLKMADKSFDEAYRYAETPHQKDTVAVAQGDHLAAQGLYIEAAAVYGKSSKSFEEVCLTFLDNNEPDALRKYLLTKLASLKKSQIMQRIMIASWLIEVFMSKLNTLDDTISTKAELNMGGETQAKAQLAQVRAEYQEFINKYKGDLDRDTTYEIVSSHGRREELLYYATSINDYSYVLAYWIQREKWLEALDVLKRQVDPEMFYKYSSVLMTGAPMDTVNILMRQSNLNPRHLIPAMLNYNKDTMVPLSQNQAVRYLQYVINQVGNNDAAVHNTLISIYASHISKDETALLSYLESHAADSQYDADFALRLCIQYGHVQSCVHIYSSMGQYYQAVELALKHKNVELASIVADRPEEDPVLRKKLWLAVAKEVISQSEGIKTAIEFLKQCELLKIEDLIPFFPDFVVIDDFKEEICSALEEYSRHIDMLKKEMDESAQTAENIRNDILALDTRYAIVEPGEQCYHCQYPLLSRQFFVFPCQHAFHSDCLTAQILKQAGAGKKKRIHTLQNEISKGVATGKARERAVEELDGLIANACILCSEFAVKAIDQPFIGPEDDKDEWAL
ncbi:putative vacuolar protein sorting-associated protein [Terfezia claveryi]|nr:putative vacuolar protein sorting-associated protein [Terfezia claveryi]